MIGNKPQLALWEWLISSAVHSWPVWHFPTDQFGRMHVRGFLLKAGDNCTSRWLLRCIYNSYQAQPTRRGSDSQHTPWSSTFQTVIQMLKNLCANFYASDEQHRQRHFKHHKFCSVGGHARDHSGTYISRQFCSWTMHKHGSVSFKKIIPKPGSERIRLQLIIFLIFTSLIG